MFFRRYVCNNPKMCGDIPGNLSLSSSSTTCAEGSTFETLLGSPCAVNQGEVPSDPRREGDSSTGYTLPAMYIVLAALVPLFLGGVAFLTWRMKRETVKTTNIPLTSIQTRGSEPTATPNPYNQLSERSTASTYRFSMFPQHSTSQSLLLPDNMVLSSEMSSKLAWTQGSASTVAEQLRDAHESVNHSQKEGGILALMMAAPELNLKVSAPRTTRIITTVNSIM